MMPIHTSVPLSLSLTLFLSIALAFLSPFLASPYFFSLLFFSVAVSLLIFAVTHTRTV